jgi:hypothetical protein
MEVGPGTAKEANDDIEMDSKYETDAKLKNAPEIVVEKTDTYKTIELTGTAPKTADEEAREIQLDLESQSMWITDTFIDHPCKLLCLGMLCMMGLTALAVNLKYFDLEP